MCVCGYVCLHMYIFVYLCMDMNIDEQASEETKEGNGLDRFITDLLSLIDLERC